MTRAILPSLFASLTLTGCIVDSEPDPVVVTRGSGLLTVTWTVDGTDDPAICAFEGVDTIDILVERANGGSSTHVTDLCEAFVTSVELVPGGYFADALLMDTGGRPLTTTADLGFFDVYGGEEVVIDVDFPSDSFL